GRGPSQVGRRMDAPKLSNAALIFVMVPFAATAIWLLVALVRSRANELPILPAVALIIVTLGGIAFLEPSRVDEWAKFKQEHNCRVVEKRDGQATSGGGVGVFSGSTSPQTAYLCDDGVTYWKNE